MVTFPIDLTPDDNGTILVTCPLLPMVATFGEDAASARFHARDAVETALAAMIADGDAIPRPPSQIGSDVARLSTLTALKLELYWALQETAITRAELQRRLDWKRESVDRLFRLDHGSRLDQIEAAFAALGREVSISVGEAA